MKNKKGRSSGLFYLLRAGESIRYGQGSLPGSACRKSQRYLFRVLACTEASFSLRFFRSGGRLCRNVGRELRFKIGNLILEKQFALFHALQPQLVVSGRFCQDTDRDIEIAVLELQFLDTALYCIRIQWHVPMLAPCWDFGQSFSK